MDKELEALIAEADAEREELENGGQEEGQNSEEENDDSQNNKETTEDTNDDTTEDSNDNDGDDNNSSNSDNLDTDLDNETEDNNKSDDNSNFKPVEINVNGHKVVINSQEELLAFAQKGAQSFGHEEKEPTIEEEYLKQGKLTKEDLQLLVDAKNGDSKAIAKLANSSNIDLLDVSNEDADLYTPSFNPTIPSEIDKVAQSILNNTELASKFQQVSSSLPESFINAISSNANDLKVFAQQVENGLAEEIIPQAIKYSYTGMSFAEAYVKAGHEIIASKNNTPSQEQKPQPTREVSDREKRLRQQASERTNNNSGASKIKDEMTEDEVWNLSEDEFAELTKSKK